MKKSNLHRIISLSLVFALFVVLGMGPVPSASADSMPVEKVTKPVNQVLDKTETYVGDTSPLADFKKQLYDKYGLRVQPYYRMKVDFTDNAFGQPKDGETETIWTFAPGIKVQYDKDDVKLGLGYEADFDVFQKHSRQNVQNQNLAVNASLTPSKETYLKISENLVSVGATAGDAAFEPVEYTDNTVNVTGGYHVDDNWTAQMGYENFNREFDSDADRFDYNEHKLDWRAYRLLSKDIRGYAGYRLGFVNFERLPTRDTIYHEFPVGIEGKLFWGIIASASVGYHRRNLQSKDRNDVNMVVAAINLQKYFLKTTSVQLSFLRRPVESSYENQTIYDEKTWYLGVNHLLNSKLRGRAGVSYSNRDFEEDSFVGTRFIVGGRTFVAANDVRERSDDIVSTHVGFDYIVRKWLILNIDYRFSKRMSNVDGLDSTENRLSVGSTIPL